MRRLGIFLFYDADGVVDDYVPFFLKQLKPFCDDLAVVVNGSLVPAGHSTLKESCDKLILRKNEGFDSWAYKHAIETYGYDKVEQFDELLLCNYTFFGPIHPFDEMFSEMEKRQCDFWGVHRHPEQEGVIADVKIEQHVQSHFIVFRKSILKSAYFREYWGTLQPVNSYEEAIARHELRCTPYFERLGYSSSCYVDPEKYFGFLPGGNASVLCAYKQVSEDRCPILKRKVFFLKNGKMVWDLCDGAKNFDVVKYIKSETSYDVQLIYKNIVRTQDVGSLPKRVSKNNWRNLKYRILPYLLPSKREHYKRKLENSISPFLYWDFLKVFDRFPPWRI